MTCSQPNPYLLLIFLSVPYLSNHFHSHLYATVCTLLLLPFILFTFHHLHSNNSLSASDDVLSAIRPVELCFSILMCCASQYLSFFFIPASDRCAGRCFALLMLTVSLWITEAMPYYTTALFIPVFVVIMGVLKDPTRAGEEMSPEVAAPYVLNNSKFEL